MCCPVGWVGIRESPSFPKMASGLPAEGCAHPAVPILMQSYSADIKSSDGEPSRRGIARIERVHTRDPAIVHNQLMTARGYYLRERRDFAKELLTTDTNKAISSGRPPPADMPMPVRKQPPRQRWRAFMTVVIVRSCTGTLVNPVLTIKLPLTECTQERTKLYTPTLVFVLENPCQ